MKTTCYTYFTISGDFNPDEVTALLNIQPFKKWNKGEANDRGGVYESSKWSACKCEDYDAYTDNQMKKTIAPLLDKIDLLVEFKQSHNVNFSLVVVPEIYASDIKPCLSPSLDIIDFCHATRTEIDIDYYIY